MTRIIRYATAAAAFAVLAPAAGAASAQPGSSQTSPGRTGVAASPRDTGVLRPPAHIDPGIARPTPALPPQSTPVIHPRRLRKNGQGTARVVPK